MGKLFTVLGLMSGTSGDGVDASIISSDGIDQYKEILNKYYKYDQKIYEKFEQAGYYCQHWLLNSAVMGVPQRRERVFFIC